MQYSAKIQATITMFDMFFQSFAPFDIILAKFFRNNKWIGGNDRREIAEFSYAIFRDYERMKFYTSAITAEYGRFFVLAFLKANRKLSDKKIMEIFSSGGAYSPQKLSDFEQRFIGNINVEADANCQRHIRLNYPEWMDEHLRRSFPSEYLENEMIALNEKACVDLRVNTLKTDRDTVYKMLDGSHLHAEKTPYAPNGLRILNGRIGRNHEVIANGLAEIQDEGSQLVTTLMCDANPTDTVVDLCAGAGGKTLAMAADMQNKGRIFALDKYQERLENAKIRFRRAGVNNVFCQKLTSKWIKRHLECADVVLADVPCSGTGTWRRNPDMRAKFFGKDLIELELVQSEILKLAQRLVKKRGRLVYATCSVLMEENEYQIENFLVQFPEFEVVKGIAMTNQAGYLKLSPSRNGTDGFFAACLRKIG